LDGLVEAKSFGLLLLLGDLERALELMLLHQWQWGVLQLAVVIDY
jgi:hypothetical protein